MRALNSPGLKHSLKNLNFNSSNGPKLKNLTKLRSTRVMIKKHSTRLVSRLMRLQSKLSLIIRYRLQPSPSHWKPMKMLSLALTRAHSRLQLLNTNMTPFHRIWNRPLHCKKLTQIANKFTWNIWRIRKSSLESWIPESKMLPLAQLITQWLTSLSEPLLPLSFSEASLHAKCSTRRKIDTRHLRKYQKRI